MRWGGDSGRAEGGWSETGARDAPGQSSSRPGHVSIFPDTFS